MWTQLLATSSCERLWGSVDMITGTRQLRKGRELKSQALRQQSQKPTSAKTTRQRIQWAPNLPVRHLSPPSSPTCLFP